MHKTATKVAKRVAAFEWADPDLLIAMFDLSRLVWGGPLGILWWKKRSIEIVPCLLCSRLRFIRETLPGFGRRTAANGASHAEDVPD
jgi:hypothetical protein